MQTDDSRTHFIISQLLDFIQNKMNTLIPFMLSGIWDIQVNGLVIAMVKMKSNEGNFLNWSAI